MDRWMQMNMQIIENWVAIEVIKLSDHSNPSRNGNNIHAELSKEPQLSKILHVTRESTRHSQ